MEGRWVEGRGRGAGEGVEVGRVGGKGGEGKGGEGREGRGRGKG